MYLEVKMACKIRPIRDRIVIKPKALEEKTQGGLYIPVKNDEKVMQGEVLAVGEGKLDSSQPLVVKVGDQVVFNQYSATEIEHEGEKYMVLREEDVVAIIE